ncbi:MAG: hypothetical protein M3N02_04660 [Pseudomonadota bacterium]|nr:hypothetical protein [Pseudomonadota bacterium]
MMTIIDEAVAALDAKKSAERQLAYAAECPPWRHAIFGLLMGFLVSTPAFPFEVRMVILAVILAGIGLIIRSDRKRMGMFINGYRRGRTRLITFPMLAIVLLLYAYSCYLGLDRGDTVTPLFLALAAFAVSVIGSIIWQRVFVSELGA